MELACSSKIEIVFNYFDAGKDDNEHFLPTPIERIVSIDGEEIYRDKQKPAIYAKDKSILRQFEDWANEYHSNIENDYLLELREYLRAYHRVEQDLITTNPTLYESEQENHTDSYIWLRLPILDEHPETISNMISSGVEELPNTCLAGILAAILKNRVPKGVDLNGMSIDRIGNSFQFCISGSTSLEDLRILCEQYELNPDLGD